jgi:arsenate reductase
MRVAFVCVQNAGRSQMATAFAQRMQNERDLDVEILSGGTRPADHVHEIVVEALAEKGIDISDRTPREITPEELQETEVVVTMGCSAEDVCPATWSGDDRDWGLPDPEGKPLPEVREIRDDIERRVEELLDEL